MKQHRIICIPTLTFALLLMFTPSILQAQDKPVFPIDSLITVGYATGNKKNISGSVEKITELGMNKDQPIRWRRFADVFPDLPYKKEPTDRQLWMPYVCGELLH